LNSGFLSAGSVLADSEALVVALGSLETFQPNSSANTGTYLVCQCLHFYLELGCDLAATQGQTLHVLFLMTPKKQKPGDFAFFSSHHAHWQLSLMLGQLAAQRQFPVSAVQPHPLKQKNWRDSCPWHHKGKHNP